MALNFYVQKLFGAILLFTVTFLVTLLPYKLKKIQEVALKGIKCFCGGLFLGLCFIHLIPDVIRDFQNIPQLKSLQAKYPIAEFTICVGMVIVMSAERFASIIQAKKKSEEQRCLSTKDCCESNCKKDEKSPLIAGITSVGYSPPKQHQADDIYEKDNLSEKSVEKLKDIEASIDYDEDNILTRSTNSIVTSFAKREEIKKHRLRAFCLILALMIHSLFEGLTVGLQSTTMGLVELVALLCFHKCLIGFSLGVNIINAGQDFKMHLKQGLLFAAASPTGIIFGVIITTSKLHILNGEATAFLTATATGTFLYITFFEILAKDLKGNKISDLVNFVLCLLGFAFFAGLTAIPALQV